MIEPSYRKLISTSSNTVIALGQAVGGSQNIAGAQGVADATATPWSQREFVVRANSQGDAAEVSTTASEEAERRKILEKLTFSPVQQNSSQYGVDYFLGDKVTAKYLNIEAHYIVSGITINLSPGQAEDISIDLEVAT
jgi:hypothetical protein